ncbi:NADH-quinone oxidoreductase subunit K [Puniceicoccaceae bacterium K14]|nr:NADH-quinone oxidoreductase subunit K [Puniceicoccaceae bacterium K14]
MELINAIIVGFAVATGVYCILRRSLLRFVIGIALISQSINLLVFTAGGLTKGDSPFIEYGKKTIEQPFADPLPQALVLTAIVIGFGLLVFTLALAQRAIASVGSDDIENFRNTD